MKNWNFHCLCQACQISECAVRANRIFCHVFQTLNTKLTTCEDNPIQQVGLIGRMCRLAGRIKTLADSEILDMLERGFDIAVKAELWTDALSFAKDLGIVSRRIFGESHAETQIWQKEIEILEKKKNTCSLN